MQDLVYSHAPVESVKAINHHNISSYWINLMEKSIKNRTCSIPCGKHMWNKFHISFFFFFQFLRYVSLMCSKNTYGKHTVETRLNTDFYLALLARGNFSFIRYYTCNRSA